MAEKKQEIITCAVSELNNEYSTYFNKNFNVDGSPTDVDLENIFNSPQDYINEIVGYSKYSYRKYGIIMRLINMYRDFGCTDLHLDYTEKNQEVEDVIKAYNKQINIKQLIRDMLYELSLTGNLVCYDRNGKRVDIYPIDRIDVTPLIINNRPVLAYKLESDFISSEYDEKFTKKVLRAFPKEILKAKDSDKAILDYRNTHFAKINASQYEKYGLSVLLPAFEDLSHKNLLKSAEKSTAKAIIDKVVLTKIGDKDNQPSQALVAQYDKVLQNVSGSVALTVPYYVNMEFVEPKTDVFGAEKFIEIDKDILNTLGVSISLLRGEGGGSYSDGIVNFTGLCRSIEAVREPLIPIIRDLYKAELKRKKLDPELAPTPRFEEVVIDKDAKTELLVNLFQNAGLPYELLYEGCGFNYDHVKLLRKEENKNKVEDTFKLRAQPFQGIQNNDGGDGAPTKNDSERKTDKSKSNNDQVRPNGKSKTNMK